MKAATLLVLLLGNGGHWLAGTDVTISAKWVLKDAAAVPTADLVWELGLDGVRLAGGSVAMKAGDEGVSVTVRCPEVRARAALRWAWRLVSRDGGKELDRGEETVYAYPADLSSGWARRLGEKKLVVVDKAEGLPKLLAFANVRHTRIGDPSQLGVDQPDVVLVAADALDDSPFAQAPLVAQARAGASVMIFRQSRPERLAGYPITRRATPERLKWESRHPLLSGLATNDLDSWLAGWRDQLLPIELPPDEPAVAVVGWEPLSPPDVPGPVIGLLVVKSTGRGRLVLCQMPMGDWQTDPRSQVLLGNALDYLCSPPEPTPPPSKRRPPAEAAPTSLPTIVVPSGDRP